jgi:hypothetical protein
MIYTWLITALIFKKYNFKHFLYLLCGSGIWVSFTWFFLKGVEEVPLPRGAFLFKEEGIIPSIILFMFFTIPLILHHFSTNQNFRKIKTKQTLEKKPDRSDAESRWEEASIEDLESGDFELS